ncbi:MAG: hypothetical protein AABX77_01890 [Nanoarchaeota archaeon]
MIKSENLDFLYPVINGVHFEYSESYANFDKTEGKFVIYKKDNKVRLYGLLWSDDSDSRKAISRDWYDFEMKQVDYINIPYWIHRIKCQFPVYDRDFKKCLKLIRNCWRSIFNKR